MFRTVTPVSFPPTVELDIEDTELSPGVRRMQAVVGQEAPSIRIGQLYAIETGDSRTSARREA